MTLQAQHIEAAYCFEAATRLYRKKHFLDAQVLFERAHALEPQNTEYATACERLQVLAASLGDWFKKKPDLPVNEENSNCLFDCCCEGCGEGCAEGGCECCCESIGDGGCCDSCDCD